MRATRSHAAAAILLCLLATLAWRNVTDRDVGIHLAGGRWIAEHGAVPERDPFTYTASDREYLAYHWLFQLGLHEAHEAGGAVGLAWLRFGLLLAAGLLVADVLRLRRVSALAALLVGLAAILAWEWRFRLRPELASYLLGAATLWVLERRRQGRGSLLYLLPVIQVLWINTHLYVLGWGILAAYSVEEWTRVRSWRSPLFAWCGVSAAALLVNPYGLRAVLRPAVLASQLLDGSPYAWWISEHASPFAIAAPPHERLPIAVPLAAYQLLVLFGAVAIAIHARQRRWADVALLSLFGGLSLTAVRNVGFYALLAAPALAVALDATGRAALRLLGRGVGEVAGPAVFATVLAFAAVQIPRVASGVFYAHSGRPERFAAVLCRDCLAADAADWIAARDLRGPGFNNLSFGSVLIWRDPGRKVFIDGLNEVMGDAWMRRYLQATKPEGWYAAQSEFGFEYAALTHTSPWAPALGQRLLADPDWRLAYVDGAAAVFVRVAGPNGSLPDAVLPPAVDPGERRRLLEEHALHDDRSAALRRWLWSREPAPGGAFRLGSYLLTLGRLSAAERPLLLAVSESPHFWETHANLGTLYQRRGMDRDALAAYRRALTLDPGLPNLAPLRRGSR